MFNQVTMLSLVAICVGMSALPFSYATVLDKDALGRMQVTFYQNIMTHLGKEHERLKPAIATLNQSIENCNNTLLPAAQKTCKDCAVGKCQMDLGDLIGVGWGYVEGWVGGAAKSFAGWQGWKDVGGWGGWSDMGDFFQDAWSKTGNFFAPVGNWFKGAFGKFGDWFGGLGRKRRDVSALGMTSRQQFTVMRHHHLAKREIDAKTKACMEKCPVKCGPFLKSKIEMVRAVCGDKLVDMVDTMTKMKALFDANGTPTKGTLILSKIEYTESNFEMATLSYGEVFVTANTTSGVVRYPSQYRYSMKFPTTSAAEMAKELINKWGV